MTRLARRLPLMVILAGIGCIAMFVPAIHAGVAHDLRVARSFLHAGSLGLILVVLAGLATSADPAPPGTARQARSHLLTVLAAFTMLPLGLAIPFNESIPDTGLFNAWWEMVSAFTTTGATLYDPARLSPSLHLWRAIVGWLGGLFILIAAISILAPLKIGGFEMMSAPGGGSQDNLTRLGVGAGADAGRAGARLQPVPGEAVDAAARLMRFARVLAPVYAAITLGLWVALMLAGDPALVALCHAMATVSTSGITPIAGPVAGMTAGPQPIGLTAGSGLMGEVLIALVLILALSRRLWPAEGKLLRASDRLARDPELRLAALIVIAVPAVLVARHIAFHAAVPTQAITPWQNLAEAARTAWAGAFTALSFLTTTGFEARDFALARGWSGLSAPGLMLAGLAITGGGVATVAGGVKLLRVAALMMHGRHELDRLLHPAVVPGGGRIARRLRSEAAFLAFLFFMLFAAAIAVVTALVSLSNLAFLQAMMLSISALSNTGPLAAVSGALTGVGAPSWSGLADMTKAVLAGAMVLGRLETLAILALFNRELWRS
ncbi:potassium transporter TrkG [Paracoccus sp. p3-h83]|uniref:potassium transporter TrkG n=1 Tax=Paracoccus sp. p3-h83 TaxID=3342805 RepID=UPI0035B89775